MLKVGLYTLGCKVSLYETEAVGEAFVREGFEIAPFDERCDVYVINTCTVTAESDAKSRKYIRRAIRKNPDAVVIVIGCYSQRAPGEVAAIEGVSAVIGTQDKLSAVEIAKRMISGKNAERRMQNAELAENYVSALEGAAFEPMCIENAPRTRAYVKIEDGCECRCTYCAISGARGPVRSKAPCDVIAEVENLYKKGTLEIVLTGIETGSYGADFDEKYDLADLLAELDGRQSCGRIRLGSMAPELLSRSFVERVKDLAILVPHYHVSMQSGSDSVLRAMKRRYNRKMALDNIAYIRECNPRVMLTADLMVGFPGESEEDFADTVKFVRQARLLDAHVFAYSKREGTPAAEYDDQVPEDVKKRRSAELIKVCHLVRDEVLAEVVERGEELSCILESRKGSTYTAHSDSYIEVSCEGEDGLSGQLVSVKPISHKNGVIDGKII